MALPAMPHVRTPRQAHVAVAMATSTERGDAVRGRVCLCGHTRGWHTGPQLPLSMEEYMLRLLAYMEMPGATCELCACRGYEAKPLFMDNEERRKP